MKIRIWTNRHADGRTRVLVGEDGPAEEGKAMTTGLETDIGTALGARPGEILVDAARRVTRERDQALRAETAAMVDIRRLADERDRKGAERDAALDEVARLRSHAEAWHRKWGRGELEITQPTSPRRGRRAHERQI